MIRSSTLASTVTPVVTLVLGILIGWRLGPEPAFRAGSGVDVSGRVTLAGAGQPFDGDPESGTAAEITSLPGGESASLDEDTPADADAAVQYFPEALVPEAVFAEPAASVGDEAAGATEPSAATSDPVTVSRPSSLHGDGMKPTQSFDEDVWRSELSGLPDEATDELIEIRKRLGKVAAQTLGVASEPFPSLQTPTTDRSAVASGNTELADDVVNDVVNAEPGRLAEPRRLEVPGDLAMRPAIELAAGRQSEFDAPQRSSQSVAHKATLAAAENLRPAGQRNRSTSSGQSRTKPLPSAVSAAETDSRLAKFRDDVRTVCRLNLRNQKTPGFQRSEIQIVSANAKRLIWHKRVVASQGQLTETGSLFDLAIDGDGWFRVELGSGEHVFTRGGLLCRMSDGRLGLRTALGRRPLVPEIKLDESVTGRLLIDEHGTVSVASPAASRAGESTEAAASTECGVIVVVDFPNASDLQRVAGSLFRETAESGAAFDATTARLRQGYLELPKIDTDEELETEAELLGFADQFETGR